MLRSVPAVALSRFVHQSPLHQHARVNSIGRADKRELIAHRVVIESITLACETNESKRSGRTRKVIEASAPAWQNGYPIGTDLAVRYGLAPYLIPNRNKTVGPMTE